MPKIVFLLAVLSCLLLPAMAQQNSTPSPRQPLAPVAWDKLATLPVLHEGRIKPVDSLARFCLLQISGRTSVRTESGKLSAAAWMGHVICQNPEAKEWPLFLIENPEILQALDLPYVKWRDRYAYNALRPKLARLRELALQANKMDKTERTLVHNQTLQLYAGIETFHAMWRTFDFLQQAATPSHPDVLKAIGDKPTFADYFLYFGKQQQELERLAQADASGDDSTQQAKTNAMQALEAAQKDLSPVFREGYSNMLSVFPAPAGEKAHNLWYSPWDILLMLSRHGEYQGMWNALCEMHRAFQKQDWQTVNDRLASAQQMIVTAATARGEYNNIGLEVHYNRYDTFFYCLLLCVFSLLACAVSWLGWGEKKWYWLALVLLAVGFVIATYGMTLRVLIKQRPPVSNLYESVLFVGWFGIAMSFVLEAFFRNRMRSLGLFVGAAFGAVMLFIAGKYAQDGDNLGVLVAVLDSNFWLATHVTTITIGYSACLVAGGLGHIFILLHLLRRNITSTWQVDMERMMYGTVCFALFFAFLGTVLGGLWADQSWGRFWGWDPKENGALLIVLWYAAMMHAYVGRKIGVWGVALGTIFGNIIVAAAWWGVNLLNIGLHNYGFTSGLFGKLVIFTVIELGFIALGVVVQKATQAAEKK